LLSTLNGKPAALVSRLRGAAQMVPDVGHCAQLGELLARMHLAAADYPGELPNLRGLDWWVATAPKVAGFLAPAVAAMLADEIEVQRRFGASELNRVLPRQRRACRSVPRQRPVRW
jgi:homoserine kinase type II